jgi:hypothetical protein
MISVHSGKFDGAPSHHKGYIRLFRFRGAWEFWIGDRWWGISWR